MAQTLYLDCSSLAFNPDLNTGIQRVVRRVLENTADLASEIPVTVLPVCIGNSRFDIIPISALYPKSISVEDGGAASVKPSFRVSFIAYLWGIYIAGRELVSALSGHNPWVRRFLFNPRDKMGLGFILDNLLFKPVRMMRRLFQPPPSPEPNDSLNAFDAVNSGDILLLLDSSWHSNVWPSVDRFKKKGGSIIAVIYDLIPILHPDFCDEYLVTLFKKWFDESIPFVDGYISISGTVQNDLQAFLRKELGEKVLEKSFDSFYLGADLLDEGLNTSTVHEKQIRQTITDAFASRPAYLIVSTVEPRKNHAYLLDAFDLLWDQGYDISLIIAGRIGWKVKDLVARIMTHSQYGKRLFLLSDLTDQEVVYCYRHAKMLVFPSIVEGFGLPIVESLSNRLPVLASDTPVHREVGKNQIGYFDLSNPRHLSDTIKNIEANGIPAGLQVPDDYKWTSWRESTRQLLIKVMDIGCQQAE